MKTDLKTAGDLADSLIAKEVSVQDAMWGVANDRADALDGQMQDAAMAQIGLVVLKRKGFPSAEAVQLAGNDFYPADWSGFRDYDSAVANLAVAAAFIRSEMKRLIAAGESTYRAPRNPEQVYAPNTTPRMSSDEAIRAS